MTHRPSLSSRVWLWVAIAFTLAKLWLTLAQPIYAIGPAAHDDALFLKLARSIIQGEWLGPYDRMTLAKGPFYSMFVAAAFWAGIPLLLAQQLFYTAACAAFARSLAPHIKSAGARLIIYAMLMLNPMSWESPTNGRILRQQVYTPLALLILAGLVALYCRRREPVRAQAPWAVLVGLSLGCFWITREESVWIVPTVALLVGGCLLAAFQISAAALRNLIVALGIAVAATSVPLLTVSWLNFRNYGWFGTVEMRSSEFGAAYGALLRVKVGPDLPFVPVTREAREAVYTVSPSFAKLRPHLEGPYGRGWAGASTGVTKLPPEQLEIGSGWFMWALRDCVAAAGEAPNAGAAISFYQRLADEINAACDDGRLPAGPRRSGFLPPWHSSYNVELARTMVIFADFVLTYKSFSAYPLPSIGDDNELEVFRDVTRDRLSRKAAGPNLEVPTQDWLNHFKFESLQRLGKWMRGVLLSLTIIAHVLAIIRLIQLVRERACTFPFTVAVAAWGGTFAYLLVNAMVQVTSFPVTAVSTFSPIYPWVTVFAVAIGWDVVTVWRPAER